MRLLKKPAALLLAVSGCSLVEPSQEVYRLLRINGEPLPFTMEIPVMRCDDYLDPSRNCVHSLWRYRVESSEIRIRPSLSTKTGWMYKRSEWQLIKDDDSPPLAEVDVQRAPFERVDSTLVIHYERVDPSVVTAYYHIRDGGRTLAISDYVPATAGFRYEYDRIR